MRGGRVVAALPAPCALGLSLLLATGAAQAIEVAPSSGLCIDRWSQAEGLAQNFIRDILQTRDGYLWVATKGGLSRFDGVTFTSYSHHEPLRGEIWALAEAEDGLWVGTFGAGLCRLRSEELSCLTVEDGLAGDYVTALAKGADGSLWIGTDGQGLSRYKDGTFTTLRVANGLAGNHVRAVQVDPTGRIWIGTMRGLQVLEDGRVSDWSRHLPGVLDRQIPVVAFETDGTAWLAVFGGGVVRWQAGRFTHFEVEDGLPDLMTLSVYVDRQGTVWAGSNGGLSFFRQGRFVRYRSQPGLPPPDYIDRMAEDREGGLWLGTATAGLVRVRNCPFSTVTSEDGLASNEVHALLQDRAGDLWVGTLSGLTRLRAGQAETFTTRDGLSHASIRALAEDAQGRIWIGAERGLTVYERGRFARVAALARMDVRVLVPRRGGGFWIGTDGSGIFSLQNGRLALVAAPDALPGAEVRAMVVDARGRLWIGLRNGGLVRIDEGKLKTYSRAQGLASEAVMGLSIDRDQNLWVLTRKGVQRLKDEVFTRIGLQQGLGADFIYHMTQDQAGDYWMTSSLGVSRVERSQLIAAAEGRLARVAPAQYDSRDGMATATIPIGWQDGVVLARDGRLWFATFRGVAWVDPRRPLLNPVVPPTLIESAVLNDMPVDVSSKPVVVPPGAGDVELRYTGISFAKPERMHFRYRLEGLEHDWRTAGQRRAVYYSHLSPGPTASEFRPATPTPSATRRAPPSTSR